jgi:glycerol uptake facilitator-like aquaporin
MEEKTKENEKNENIKKKKKNIFFSILLRLSFETYLMEFIGTFFMTLIVSLTTNNKNQPLAIGITLTNLIFIGKHVGSGHYNPGVTLCVFLRQKLKIINFIFFLFSQFFAGFWGSFCAWMLLPSCIIIINY